MRLSFKRHSFGFVEKEVPILLKIGTLEDVCAELGIDFYQVSDTIQKDNFDFMVELLYQGYLTACAELYKAGKTKRKPKYDRLKAFIWYEHLSEVSQKEFSGLLTELSGKISRFKKHCNLINNSYAIFERFDNSPER